MAKVDMEQLKKKKERTFNKERGAVDKPGLQDAHLSVILDHDVAVVSVPDAQNKSSDAVTRAGAGEQVNGLVVPESNRNDRT